MNRGTESICGKSLKQMKEPELYEKLAEFGPQVHRGTYGKYLREVMSKTEDKVFSQKVSEDELNSISAGFCGDSSGGCSWWAYDQHEHCTEVYHRHIYEGEFPNCAATVEDGSWCGSNDACYGDEVIYVDMEHCGKAWE